MVGVTVAQMIALLRAVTDAVGERMELMLGGQLRLDEAQAREIGHFLDEAGWTWFEEPLPKDQIGGYVRLNADCICPSPAANPTRTRDQFEPFFARRAYAKGQLDVGVCSLGEAHRHLPPAPKSTALSFSLRTGTTAC